MGRVRDFVEFILYSVSRYHLLTLLDLVCAGNETSFWAVTFEPKAECMIVGAVPPLLSSL